MTRSSRTPRAFTLIEIIVGVAIVGVLLAITLPALSGARESGKAVRCLANLRSIGLGIRSYQDANDGLLPWAERSVEVRAGRLDPLPAIADHLDAPLPKLDGAGVASVPEPWACPSDTPEGLADGWSYSYTPWDLMGGMQDHPSIGKTAQRWVTQYYEQRFPDQPITVDHEPRHGRQSPGSGGFDGRNLLFIDGSVRRGSAES